MKNSGFKAVVSESKNFISVVFFDDNGNPYQVRLIKNGLQVIEILPGS